MQAERWIRVAAAASILALAACASTEVARLDEVDVLQRDEADIWQESEAAAVGITRELATEDAPLQAYAAAVLDRLVDASLDFGEARRPILTVLDTTTANAAAMPHGDLFVTHGMLAQLDNEAQLAFVLSHEIAHYRRRHALISERYARNQRTKSVLVSVALTALAGAPIVNQNDPAWQLALTSGYARELEIEADLAALELMAAAGYDARQAVEALEKLRDGRAEVRDPLFASHPDVDTRVAQVHAHLANFTTAADDTDGAATYVSATEHLVVPQALALIENGELATAEALLARHLKRHPEDPAVLFALGESVRASSSSRETSIRAAAYYRRAIDAGNAPVAAYRELGLHHRMMDEPETAADYFRRYLSRAPDAIDAPLIAAYLEETL